MTVQVGKGENTGHSLTYHNVVRRWVKLGDWNGQEQTFRVPLADVATKDIDTIAVVLQSGVAARPGAILGATTTSLR